jgi:chemotaxis protein CheD
MRESETETVVRIGELAASRLHREVLAVVGLGSCVGLVLIDRVRPIAGLAHVMLPSSQRRGAAGAPAKFADRAVTTLLERLLPLGSRRSELVAVLVGGARMFSAEEGNGLDIGARNEQILREGLLRAGIPVVAAATGGERGRTARVQVESGRVLCKEAGGVEVEIYAGPASPEAVPGGAG